MTNALINTQFTELVHLIQQARSNALRAVNAELVNLYWNVGRYVSHKLKADEWGKSTILAFCQFIKSSNPELKGFEHRNVYRMVQFYDCYANEKFFQNEMLLIESGLSQKVSPVVTNFVSTNSQKVSPVVTTLQKSNLSYIPQDIRRSLLVRISWTNHTTIFSRCKTSSEREFYINLCIKERYSKRELERQINSAVYERTMLGKVQTSPALQEFHQDLSNVFKDSYIFDFLNLPESHNESDLQKGLVSQMKDFILELGRDFLFVGQEYKLMVGNSDFYIDLLFYHRALQCLVAFELKTDKFRPEHLGQLNFYLEALDRDVKRDNENPSIGVLLCKDKDHEVVEYALSRNLSPTMVAEYQMALPDKAILQRKLQEILTD